MLSRSRIGIIDIGSNSIRLVIYEQHSNGAYRVVGEFKDSPRLSQYIDADGKLPPEGIARIVGILSRFKEISSAYGASRLRAAATAAIRNAANAEEIVASLRRESGIEVHILSGEEEARIGFLGMINTMDVKDGFLIDIGGGSTEVSLFRNRSLIHSVSFPFGAVNTTKKYAASGEFDASALEEIRQMVENAAAHHPWIRQSPGLPLIGLGGTLRTLAKIHQRSVKYSLPLTHNYSMGRETVDALISWLSFLPGDKRKKVDGLAKDRYDIIVPGMAILRTIFEACGATHYIVSGAGLRDGLYFEAFASQGPVIDDIASHCADNLLAFYSPAPAAHVQRVWGYALSLFDTLGAGPAAAHFYDQDIRLTFSVAAKLYRIGASMNYYQYAKHSFYMVANARIDGLTHRQILLSAMIASFKNRTRLEQQYEQHKDILTESDVLLCSRLGVLLQLAVALDISQTGALQLAGAEVRDHTLYLTVQTPKDPSVEFREVAALQKEFKKWWGLSIETAGLSTTNEPSFSTS